MNILIVGNGFDLSHYLPTKYDHFMVAMDAIENWDEAKGDMGFDDLFGSLYEKEDYFFGYTKAMYKTDEIKISAIKAEELKKKLTENVWYQYFLDHVREVKTWIDFEIKIEVALSQICKFIEKIDKNFDSVGKCNLGIYSLSSSNTDKNDAYYLSSLDVKYLQKLKLIKKNINYGKSGGVYAWPDFQLGEINKNWFIVSDNDEYGFSSNRYISFLNIQLNDFISIFNSYLELVISKLNQTKIFDIPKKELKNIDKIYSFNYTNTYLRFYNFEYSIEFLHGYHGEAQKIVLGISELHHETLKRLKAYGFTKYHQKLLKDTDYQFLSENRHAISLKSFWQSVKNGKAITLEEKEINQMIISIWGHSLDTSDEIYINEIFSFNTEFDEQVRVIVYYFDTQANFDLLANLIHILGKEKVEKWMKKGWLKFEENPDIVKFNGIQPVELPKRVS